MNLLDFLKTSKAEASAARVEAAKCKRVPLPEAFALPRRFGVSWGCLQEKAFYGFDAVVMEVNVRGVYIRYVLPYDSKARQYMAVYRERKKREEKRDRLPQYFADALYELAAKYEVEITNDSYVLVGGAEVDKTLCYQRRRAEDCARAIERYIRDWPRVLEERRRRETERR